MRKNTTVSPLARYSLWVFCGLLGYMPLHILLSTWLGSALGILPLLKVAKDIVLVIGFGAVLAASVRQPFFVKLLRQRLAWLILAFALLNIALVLAMPTDADAELLGLVYNTRFLLFFMYGVLLVNLIEPGRVIRGALRAVLLSGLVVVLFGALQYLLLPESAMRDLGYSRQNGVLPAFYIDKKPDLERIMSTVRDPNSLGSYLIVIISLVAGLLILIRPAGLGLLLGGYLMLAVACLFWTFSRSAWLGMCLCAGIMTVLLIHRRSLRPVNKKLLVLAAVPMLLIAPAVYMQRDSYFVKNLIFHADESTVLEDPNELRLRFWRESVAGIADRPWGTGPGTAGLASIRNEAQGTALNENYYLQTAQETGVLGLSLFILILAGTARRLWGARNRWPLLSTALLGSLGGLLLTNFLVHIWANEAVAYTWWGLAALAVSGHEGIIRRHKSKRES